MTISDGVREPHGSAGRLSETGTSGVRDEDGIGDIGDARRETGARGETGVRAETAGRGDSLGDTSGRAETGGPGDGRVETGDADALKDAAAGRSGIHGWLDGVRSTRAGHLTLKIVIGAIGAVLVIGGLIMVPFPGPGWLVVFAGLAVLATEFHWAHRLLEFGKRTLSAWTAWLGRRGWTVKILVVLAAAVTATAIVYYGLKLSFDLDLVVEAQKLLTR
ncbi:TIGR02611 family protein [Streptosporangium sp. V21-05]|uniref:TIGR02611 family protein n=1 Tax=Streptosporangium sp. V21-05 TaxID=3446115 RepID=UPI003F5292B1